MGEEGSNQKQALAPAQGLPETEPETCASPEIVSPPLGRAFVFIPPLKSTVTLVTLPSLQGVMVKSLRVQFRMILFSWESNLKQMKDIYIKCSGTHEASTAKN